MEGTDYLIHPVGDLRVYKRSKIWFFQRNWFEFYDFNGENEITGYLQNLKFQKTDSDSIRPLTDKPALTNGNLFKVSPDRAKKQIMVYTMFDADTNRDGKLDSSDIKSLYLSEISGKRFTKVSMDWLIDWR
jgi:hypothetical protein